MNEFMHGAIWVYEDDIPTYYNLIDEDKILSKLNEETENLYNSYYEFDSHDSPCWFNKDLEKATKDKMLNLINKINKRLAELNDGSFKIEDYETQYLLNL